MCERLEYYVLLEDLQTEMSLFSGGTGWGRNKGIDSNIWVSWRMLADKLLWH